MPTCTRPVADFTPETTPISSRCGLHGSRRLRRRRDILRTSVCKVPRWLRRSPRRSSSRYSRLPCGSNSTKIGCCFICPAPARSRRCWRRYAGDSIRRIGARHAGFSMTRHVWPTRRCCLPLSTTTSRLTKGAIA